MHILFESPRLIFRTFERTDAQKLYLNHLEPDMKRWIPNESYADIAETERAIRFFSDCVAQMKLPYVLAIVFRETNALIGDVGINEVEGNPAEAEIGYSISDAYSGKGLATEAVRAMTDYAFRTFAINCLYGRVLQGNAASERVLIKSGYDFMNREAHAPDDPYGCGMLVYRRSAHSHCDNTSTIR